MKQFKEKKIRMKSNCSLGLLILFLGVSSLASNKVGNGGDIVFCKKAQEPKGKLLDFYENSLNFESKETSAEVIAEKQLRQLQIAAPQLAEQYLKRLKSISKDIEYKSDVILTDIKDSKHLFRPFSDDCQVLQIAIRKAKIISNEKPFIICEDLWKQLSPLHQAGLLTHEIVYEHLAKLGEEDSVKARKINRFLYQSEIKKEEFWKLIKDLEVSIYPN